MVQGSLSAGLGQNSEKKGFFSECYNRGVERISSGCTNGNLRGVSTEIFGVYQRKSSGGINGNFRGVLTEIFGGYQRKSSDDIAISFTNGFVRKVFQKNIWHFKSSLGR